MKKTLLFSLCAIVLLGAGCLSKLPFNLGEKAAVEGAWDLAFDLPSGWTLAAPYDNDELESVKFSLKEVTQADSEIYLQASDKPIYLSSGETPEAISNLVNENKAVVDQGLIKVTKLDERRLIPSEAEDIGHGISQIKLCDDGGECQVGGRLNYDFYLEINNAKYKFITYNITRKEAENIISSAKVVTVHTGADVDINVNAQ